MDKVWMKPFDGGEPKEVDATPEVLRPWRADADLYFL